MKQEDLDALRNPKTYQPGPGRDQKNIDYWSRRASENSQIAPRAKGPVGGGPPGTWGEDAPALPSTTVTVRDSSMKPREPRKINQAMRGEDPAELNHTGTGNFMPNVRRKV
jgi:hypothetical protein